MGTFLMMSGIAGAQGAEVEAALQKFAAERSGLLAPLAPDAAVDESELLIIAESNQHYITVMYPESFTGWDDASQWLSEALQKPVMSLHVHDGDLWMYVLYASGQVVDQFNPLPDYWDEDLSEEELQSWAGNAAVVCKHWPNVREEEIARYLLRWDLDSHEDYGAKAYPDDEYGMGEDWQILDFMRRIGLVYPIDGNGGPIGTRYRFRATEG
jgi:hypothetical protein